MVIEDLLAKRGMTKYKLAVQAGIPHPTLSDICSGKTKLEKYGNRSFNNRRKATNTNIKKYGVMNVSENSSIKEIK